MRSISVADAPQQGWGQVVALEPRFAPMIDRLERHAASRGKAYSRKVVAAGLLGYGVLGGVLGLFLGLTGLMVALMVVTRTGIAAELKGAAIFGGIAFALARALAVGRGALDGIVLDAAEAPALAATVARIRAATGGPAIAELRITDQMNAAITQEPRFLAFGGRNTLYLGLPLLMALPVHEVEAVVAHEFGHFIGRHGASAGFAYRLRQRWAQVAERLPGGITAAALRRFFGWYGPWFAAYSFVLARSQEHEADRTAARVAGATATADALKRVAIQADRLSFAWSAIWSQAQDRYDPPASPFRTVAAALAGDDDGDGAALTDALAGAPALDDTHPTLKRRLAALGASEELPPPLRSPAADALLGDMLDELLDRLGEDWHEHADAAWAERFADAQAARAERTELAERIAAGDTDREMLYRHACLVEDMDGPAAAEPAYAAVLAHHGDAADALYRRGAVRLDMGDADGIAMLLDAGLAEPALRTHSLRRVANFLIATNRAAEAQAYLGELDEAEQVAAVARREAGEIDEAVELRAPDDALRDRLIDLTGGVTGVRSLHVGLRDLRHAPNPQIVFVFEAEPGAAGMQVLDALIDAMLPAGDLLGLQRSRKRRWLARRLEQLAGSRIR